MTPFLVTDSYRGLVGSGGGFAGFYFFEEPDDADAQEAEEREPAEDVDEGPEQGLALELLVHRCLGGGEAVGGAEGSAADAAEESLQGTELVLELLAGDGDGVDDLVLMNGSAAGEEGGGDRDSDASADVAHEVEDAAGVADLLVVERAVGGDVDGDEDEGEAEAGDEDGQEECGGRDVRGDVAEVEGGEAEGDEAKGEEVTGIYFAGEVADDGHAADGANSTGRDDDSGGQGSVAEEFLIEERQDGDGGVDSDSKEEDENAAKAEVAVLEDFEVDDGVFVTPAVPAEVDEGDDKSSDGPANPYGAEPVVLLSLVEYDLEAASPDDESGEAVAVECGDLGVAEVGWIVDEAVDHEEGEDADGDVDVEGIAPGIGVGEPAA